eukprot:m.97065 g.97065  ORF g.97065 m.97065 type:complete len:60 (+) comp12484_c0_seq1:934-1113(+)
MHMRCVYGCVCMCVEVYVDVYVCMCVDVYVDVHLLCPFFHTHTRYESFFKTIRLKYSRP